MQRLLAAFVAVALAGCIAQTPSPGWSYGPLAASGSPTASPIAPHAPTASRPASPTPTPSTAPGAIRDVGVVTARLSAGDPAGSDARRVVSADSAFALRLYGRLAHAPGNLIFSPYSISTALSMTLGGARGKTADEVATILGAGRDLAAWHRGRNDLDQWLSRAPTTTEPGYIPFQIQPTDALFGQDGLAFEGSYLELLASDYGAGLHACDFAGVPDACRATINAWVADRTADKIRELLGAGAIDDTTRFVLVNAILFRAGWSDPFEASGTSPAVFHRLGGSTIRVPTMHGSVQAMGTDGDGWQAVELWYSGASMTIIAPDLGRFAQVERRLGGDLLAAIEARHSFALVHLALPSWTATTSAELIPPLQALGIHDLFDRTTADLSGITEVPLSVSAVVHQATISVDEKGTEAAAATAVVGGTTGGGPGHEMTIRVDRPFMYLIRDDASGEILFAGRVLDPTPS